MAAAAALKQGDPLAEESELGPMARADLRDELHQQVQATIAEGAELRLGGEMPSGAGNFYPATVLTNVTPDMTAFREELFGPVAAIAIAKSAEHALELANDSDFGLSATLLPPMKPGHWRWPHVWNAAVSLSTALAPAMPGWRLAA